MNKIVGVTVVLLGAFLTSGAADAEEPVCPEGTHAIYTAEAVLVSCEELIGSPAGDCLEDEEPGYLEDGTLAGCFGGALAIEELCSPVGVDTDEDGLDDGCDPCPENADCDADGFCDGSEMYIGTDPLDACPDDPTDDAWPFDINVDTWANILDVLLYKGHLQTQVGDPDYEERLDLNADGSVNILDILLYKPVIATTCDALQGEASVGTWCWPCVDLPVDIMDVWAHGEFRWTIHIPWPWPDQYRVKYSMSLRTTFVWIESLDVAGVSYASASKGAEWPYYIFDDPWIMFDSESPSQWTVEAGTAVSLFPSISQMMYPIRLWIDFWVPGIIDGGGENFHYWWIEEQ